MKVFLIMAQTLDGIISRSSDEFIDWTGSADKKMFMQVTKEAGVVIMGSKTYDTIGRPLPGRRNIVLTRNKERVSNSADLIYTSQGPKEILAGLSEDGFTKAAVIGGSQINTLFARENLIDEYIITVAPYLFGKGLSIFSETLDIELELISTTLLEEKYLLLRYKRNT